MKEVFLHITDSGGIDYNKTDNAWVTGTESEIDDAGNQPLFNSRFGPADWEEYQFPSVTSQFGPEGWES